MLGSPKHTRVRSEAKLGVCVFYKRPEQHRVNNEAAQSRQSFYIPWKTRRQQSDHPLHVTRSLRLCVFAVVLCALAPASFGLLLPTRAQNGRLTSDYVRVFIVLAKQ